MDPRLYPTTQVPELPKIKRRQTGPADQTCSTGIPSVNRNAPYVAPRRNETQETKGTAQAATIRAGSRLATLMLLIFSMLSPMPRIHAPTAVSSVMMLVNIGCVNKRGVHVAARRCSPGKEDWHGRQHYAHLTWRRKSRQKSHRAWPLCKEYHGCAASLHRAHREPGAAGRSRS